MFSCADKDRKEPAQLFRAGFVTRCKLIEAHQQRLAQAAALTIYMARLLAPSFAS